MKNLYALTFMFVLFLISCNNNQSNTEATESEISTEKSIESGDFKKSKNCDEFLDNYEKWIDNYLKMIEKYMKNPMDQSLMEDYTKQAADAMTWYSQWDIMECATKEKYEKRFDKISEKVDKKMKELGLE